MKTLDQIYEVGEEIDINIVKPNVGKFPIGKTESGNVTCVFEQTKKYIEIGTVWKVQIVQVKKRNLLVKPIRIVKTKKDVEHEYELALAKFKENGFKSGSVIFK